MFKFLFRLTALSFIVMLAVQPYNWFCQFSHSCNAFYFSDLIPRFEGKSEFPVIFEAKNYYEDVYFAPNQAEIKTVTNRKNSTTFKVTNLGKSRLTLHFLLETDPKGLEKNIKFYECLCFHKVRLKPKESVDLPVTFLISSDVYSNKDLVTIFRSNQPVKIRYVVKAG